jgi:hypothetical protein
MPHTGVVRFDVRPTHETPFERLSARGTGLRPHRRTVASPRRTVDWHARSIRTSPDPSALTGEPCGSAVQLAGGGGGGAPAGFAGLIKVSNFGRT